MRGLLLVVFAASSAWAQVLPQTPVIGPIPMPAAPAAGALFDGSFRQPALLSPAPVLLSPALGALALPRVEAAIPAVHAAPFAAARDAGILSLRATQFSAGMREVDEKEEKLRGMGHHEREKYLKDHPIPVAVGPGGALYILDHHHLALAAWRAGVTELPVEVRADLSGLSTEAFWAEMGRRHWVYLYDQDGSGPLSPSDLPRDVRGLADDVYRSVAWQVRERGGYRKTDEFFIEFRWADFFRKNLRTDPSGHFKRAVDEAMELAKSPLARDLPGYVGPG